MPRRVADAMNRFNEQCTLGDQEDSLPPQFFSGIREKAYRFDSLTNAGRILLRNTPNLPVCAKTCSCASPTPTRS